jgi:hypothetical protein
MEAKNVKIILPTSNKNESAIIVDPDTLTMAEGYSKHWVSETQWTIKDERGRINVSFIRNYIIDIFEGDKSVSDKAYGKVCKYSFEHYTRSKTCDEARDYYKLLIGFDPIKTVNGGYRKELLNDGNGFTNTGVLIGADKKVRVTGTYMTIRMFQLYASRVNLDFQEFVYSLFDERLGDRDLSSILIKPTDTLKEEFDDINSRVMFKFNIGSDPHLLNEAKHGLPDVVFELPKYIEWLRSDYFIDIEVDTLLKWLRDEGLFMLDQLGTKHDAYDYYYPKPAFTSNGRSSLFKTITMGDFHEIFITPYGHDRIIEALLKDFYTMIGYSE